ncbi:MAG: terminase small subunit [Alphaproteobacteria bacterium]|nr:terminase small subunit [Alphaproteobacteria bacterium]
MASAFDSLTPRQAKFVTSYVRLGGKPQAAGLAAGYSGRSAHVSASKLLRLPKILAAIREETERRLTANVALAAEALVNLAETAESESVRLQAAQALLDRGGMLLAHRTEHVHTLRDERTDQELRDRILALAHEVGLPAKLVDVTPAALPAPADGAEHG